MTKRSIKTLRTYMHHALQSCGYDDQALRDFIVDMYLDGELQGHTTHGLGTFPAFLSHERDMHTTPSAVATTESLYVIDAHGLSGNVIGKQLADEAIQRASQSGMATAAAKNMVAWLRPGGVADYIARQGYIAIVINNGRAATVAPPNGYEPVIGTNPVAFAAPAGADIYSFDLALAKQAWGNVRQANKDGSTLDDDTFYDNHGSFTTDPSQAISVIAAGDYKGFALAFMIEVLCRPLLGMAAQTATSDSVNTFSGSGALIGGVVMVVDPSATTDAASFGQEVRSLLDGIQKTAGLHGGAVRMPGESAKQRRIRALADDEVEVADSLWHLLSQDYSHA